ncbi:serine/threonine protein kinase [Stieleria marina]
MPFIPPDHYDEQTAQLFVSSLEKTPTLTIEDWLDQADGPSNADVIETIVKADMAFRWQKISFAGPVEIEQATYVKPPTVETYAERFSLLSAPEILKRLAKWELLLRQKIGDKPSIPEYSKRFAQLGDPNDWLVDDLNANHLAQGNDRLIGSTVGTFKIVSKISDGSFSVSYQATQFRPTRQQVVIKFLKREFDSADVLNRFRFEQQSMEIMDHPHIVGVSEAATTPDGSTYFATPWISGVPITQWSIDNACSFDERVDVFIQACDAVQHAHQKGIIHRDLRPSKILVAEQDQQPHTNVIDFGISRAIGSQLGQQTVATHYGGSTASLQYISPEQASFKPSDVDTRSDVYSLGVVLYEMLVGEPPFTQADLSTKAIDQTLRIIRQTEPDAPGTRVEQLPRELEWIVLHALKKDRKHRYQSPGDLADDLRRYRDGRAVTVAPRSWIYDVGHYSKQNPVSIVLMIVFAILFFAAGVAATWWMQSTNPSAQFFPSHSINLASEKGIFLQ